MLTGAYSRVIAGLIAASSFCSVGPAAAHEWVDYFRPGQSELSTRGYQMAAEVAAYARQHRIACVIVVGHVDTLETHEFSDELDRRRAQAVATELALQGLDPAIIDLKRRGARQPARPTADRVSENLNRRVTVGATDRPCPR